MTDPMVRRANALVTTFLDLLGVLLLAAAAGWWLWAIAPAAGLCGAGAIVLVMSLAAQHRGRPAEPAAVADDPEFLPGPADPGNVHVMGR